MRSGVMLSSASGAKAIHSRTFHQAGAAPVTVYVASTAARASVVAPRPTLR